MTEENSLPIIVRFFREPQIASQLSPGDWDFLIRQARAARLLATLMHEVEKVINLAELPKPVQSHLESVRVAEENARKSIYRELEYIDAALHKLTSPVVVLKGGAYVGATLPNAVGRLLSDIDLMVYKGCLSEAEKKLNLYGWFEKPMDEYDQKYFREWMHELPPFVHLRRGTIIDLHHNILPLTVKSIPDANKLFEDIRKLEGFNNLYVLSPVDMVLHSATHLFQDGELEHGFRDILDLNSLFQYFSDREPDFWETIVPRAKELNLSIPLFYSFQYCRLLLKTEIPESVYQSARNNVNTHLSSVMDALFFRALMPAHKTCNDWFTPIARWLLYVRSHYLRMPLYLLIPHLVRKAYKKRFDDTVKSDAN